MSKLIARPASESILNGDPGREIDSNEAFRQIGRTTLWELGAKNLAYSKDYIQFDTTGKRRRVIVKLTVWDTYAVEIGRMVKRNHLPTYEVLHQVEMVYCDQLASVIRDAVDQY